jgi:hypothetical protein
LGIPKAGRKATFDNENFRKMVDSLRFLLAKLLILESLRTKIVAVYSPSIEEREVLT